VREVLEETGLVVRAERILAVLGGERCRVRYANGDEVEYVVTAFSCTVLGGELCAPDDESKRLAYFARSSAPALAFPYPDATFDSRDAAAPFFDGAR